MAKKLTSIPSHTSLPAQMPSEGNKGPPKAARLMRFIAEARAKTVKRDNDG